MPAVPASWLVGYTTLPAVTLTGFDGQSVAVAAGTYALRHSTASLSLLDVVNAAIDASASAITCTSLVILRNRHVQINLSAPADINFLTGSTNGALLAAALGFDDDQTGDDSYTAPYISPLLFSSGYPLQPTTISGVGGYTVSHQSRYKADDGTQLYVTHYGDETWQELRASHVVPSRMRTTGTTAAQGGTFHQFYEQVLKYGRRFLHYESVTEDSSSTTAVTWTTALGPYAMRDVNGDWYRRNVPNAEVSSPLEIPCILLDEVA